jgi:hypothetical protein
MKLRYSITLILAVVGLLVFITLLSACVHMRTEPEVDEIIEFTYEGGGDDLCFQEFIYACETQIYGLEMVGI